MPSFDWRELQVQQSGDTVVTPCLAFTMWFGVTEAPILIDFYQRAMEAVGPLLTHYIAESMKLPARITPRARTMVPIWIKKPAEFKFYHARFSGAADVHAASLEVYFQAKARLTPEQQEAYRRNLPILVEQGLLNSGVSSSTFRVTLPVDHPLAEPKRFANWALDFAAVKQGEFVTGGCDYSLNYDDDRWGRGVRTAARALCSRYPGLDFYQPSIHLWFHRYLEEERRLLPLAKRAGWITMVNEQAVAHLGGDAKLEADLKVDPAVRMVRLAHGLALQCGEAPRLGDVGRLDVPYRSIAAAIRPVRIERVGQPGYPDEWMGEWLDMLDRPLPGAQP